ncbi:MAG: hypothetical protein K6F01_00930 [Selenomonas sp.]|uniref:hypothetical protein n=1 Tax=Selenomonas sp. TaxID=2053611 RepID=UPI0025FD6320|nr:hypothetical protein [Selenomonas sp.]MCR5438011.1 hypothetical protein [Selenomonas sp.]
MEFRGLVAMCNLLLSASNVLKNRYLHVDWKEETAHWGKKQPVRQIRDSQSQYKDPK